MPDLHDSIMQTTSVPYFFRLSAELRNQIYSLVVIEAGKTVDIVKTEDKSTLPPGLIQTCRRLRSVAAPMYYGSNHFEVWKDKQDDSCATTLLAWLRCVPPQYRELLRTVQVNANDFPLHPLRELWISASPMLILLARGGQPLPAPEPCVRTEWLPVFHFMKAYGLDVTGWTLFERDSNEAVRIHEIPDMLVTIRKAEETFKPIKARTRERQHRMK